MMMTSAFAAAAMPDLIEKSYLQLAFAHEFLGKYLPENCKFAIVQEPYIADIENSRKSWMEKVNPPPPPPLDDGESSSSSSFNQNKKRRTIDDQDQDADRKRIKVIDNDDDDVKSDLLRFGISEFTESTMQVVIKTLTGKTFTITTDSSHLVSQFKERVRIAADVPVNQQRLIFAGKQQLEDNLTLGDYNVPKEATFHMVLRLRGGMYDETSGREKLTPLLFAAESESESAVAESEEFSIDISRIIEKFRKCSSLLGACQTNARNVLISEVVSILTMGRVSIVAVAEKEEEKEKDTAAAAASKKQ